MVKKVYRPDLCLLKLFGFYILGDGKERGHFVFGNTRLPPDLSGTVALMAALNKALERANISLRKYDPSKARPIQTGDHTTLSIAKFSKLLIEGLKTELPNFPEIIACINNPQKMEELLEEWAEENPLIEQVEEIFIPEDLSDLTLNVDTSIHRREGRYFCTTRDELIENTISGEYYIDRCGLDIKQAIRSARPVVPKYLPRLSLGLHPHTDPTTGRTTSFYNTYVPAPWALWKMKNREEWNRLPAKPPSDLIEMLKYIIPLKQEREYFYAWLYTSITSRAYVYLVLQGIPGLGKNRLQVLLTALHGKRNSVNGKKETFGANGSKFNGQLFESTAVWFDELKYDNEMEPRMKEYQNDSASKELKGIDATGSSDLYCSMVISNNYQRDNYILFNSRKFAPIVLGNTPLKNLMSEATIGSISNKLDESHADFDVKYVAQIAKWILKIGTKYVDKFPRLEYQGPKFWELAHASMSRWQKVVVVSLTGVNSKNHHVGWVDKQKAFQWTLVEANLRRRKEFSDKDYRDPSTVKAFFDNYRDTDGKKVFETKAFKGSILQDFWVWPISEHRLEDKTITNDEGTLIRPKGMSDFQWRKMKAEKGKDIDDL